MIELFDVMLGGVSTELSGVRKTWVEQIVDYEARAHQAGREVTNTELTDNVAMPARPAVSDRKHVMREVGKLRKKSWYPTLILSRRIYLIDNPDTV